MAGALKNLFGKKNSEEQADAVEEEILSIIEEGHEQGAIQTDEAEMISNVFEFGDKQVRDVCSPRQKILGIEADNDINEALQIMLDNSYSRYPIYEENIDNIIGVLHIKEAVAAYLENANQTVRDLGSEPYFVHPTQNIQKLLKDMQTKKVHMAIVVDEYGQTEGIVAMEDILEEIVGNILDEHDEEEHNIIRLGKPDSFLMRGMSRLEEIAELLEIEFPDEDIDTLNGFILYELGRLPIEGEEINVVYQGYTFHPIDIHDKMVVQVKVTKNPEAVKEEHFTA